eukprot:CAMPEP_0119267226 /NCGR_PEP_ID=MMETSP1329-20130426/5449_1 /TAXON_ID=114041 /ORGANISM="Genus nov. species nov., Strain RCC1024" /LENGTH=266 /DNA_ID=CAMNT_0007267141 /DNA_START=78 /DNA_END=874 /DNA_ORIENTATION=-
MLARRIAGAAAGTAARPAASGAAARPLSAIAESSLPTVDESFAPGFPGAGFESSTLDNGVVVVTSAPGPVGLVGVSAGYGSLRCPPAGAFAARAMAFKSANGRSDLAIQRDLELAGGEPVGVVGGDATFVGVSGSEDPAAAFAAAATAAGVGRDALVAWEFEETKASPGVVGAFEMADPLVDACLKAAYGPGFGADAASLAALDSAAVDQVYADIAEGAPLTAVGVGMAHADMVALAKEALGALGPRAASSSPAFVPGGLVFAGVR